jgi:hypothetical protein
VGQGTTPSEAMASFDLVILQGAEMPPEQEPPSTLDAFLAGQPKASQKISKPKTRRRKRK